jgi:CheY-like chemotaxis protein
MLRTERYCRDIFPGRTSETPGPFRTGLTQMPGMRTIMIKKILIVEDERLIGKLLAKTLKNSGYQICDVVASGEEAIAFTKKEKLDAIVMDVLLMGEMDGFEAASIIRKEHSIPIIFLTCFSDEDISERAGKIERSSMIDKFDNLLEIQKVIEMAVS